MRRATVVAAAGLLQAALLAGTVWAPVGTSPWHHLWSLIGVLALAVAFRRPLQSRRMVSLGLLATSLLAAASGFILLYAKEAIRTAGYQDWGVFWHVAWSWGAAVLVWQHTWLNRISYGHFLGRSLAGARVALPHLAAYGLGLAAFLVTAGPGKGWFTIESYIPLSYWAWLVTTSAAYVGWWLLRNRPSASRKAARGGVDVALVPVSVAAIVSGIPLLFMDPLFESWGLKYASKFWHVAPSVLFCVLAFVHTVQLGRTVRAHWRNAGRRAPPVPPNAPG